MSLLGFSLEPTDLIRNSPNFCGDPLGLSNLVVCGASLIFYLPRFCSCLHFRRSSDCSFSPNFLRFILHVLQVCFQCFSAFFRLCLQSKFSQVRSACFTSLFLVFLDPKLQFRASSFFSFWNHSNPSSVVRDSNEIKNSFWVVVLVCSHHLVSELSSRVGIELPFSPFS